VDADPPVQPPLLHPSLTRVLVAIKDLPLHQEVLDFVTRHGRVDVVGAMTEVASLRDRLDGTAVDAIVCCAQVAFELVESHAPPGAPAGPAGSGPQIYVVSEELSVPALRTAIAV